MDATSLVSEAASVSVCGEREKERERAIIIRANQYSHKHWTGITLNIKFITRHMQLFQMISSCTIP